VTRVEGGREIVSLLQLSLSTFSVKTNSRVSMSKRMFESKWKVAWSAVRRWRKTWGLGVAEPGELGEHLHRSPDGRKTDKARVCVVIKGQPE
jgi:hypothetical protein